MSEGDLLRLAGGGFPRGLKCSKQSLPGNPWDILPKIQFGMTCRKCKTLKETDTLLNCQGAVAVAVAADGRGR